MILKKRKKPRTLAKLEAFIPRLSAQHPLLSEIKQDAAKRYQGYIGELKVDYFLEQHLPNYFCILQDVELRIDERNFQMDNLIISPHGIYLIETKNFIGTITFNTILGQFTRHNGNTETGYRNPIIQAETQKQSLINWLSRHQFPLSRVEYFIGISEPSTVVKVIGDSEKVADRVIHGELLPNKILTTEQRMKLENRKTINHQQIARKILSECRESDIDILKKYNIPKSKLRTGVACPECHLLEMVRKHGRWNCVKCKSTSVYAHKKAINDYLLFKPWITNRECRKFLHIQSRSTATRLLKKNDLIYIASKKHWVKKT